MGQVSAPSGHLVRVAIRSPRRLFRDTLAVCLSGQPEFTVVGHVADDIALLGLCDLCGPDLVVYDAGPAVGEALRALRALRTRFAGIRLVVIYERLSPTDLSGTRQAGVDTLIPCSHGLDALLMLLHQHADALRSGAVVPVPGGLSTQEREIITLTAAGHPVSRIAELLTMTPFAVENCKRRIYQKLAVTSQSHAIARAITLGLVNRSPVPRPRVYAAGGLTLAVLCGPDGPARYDVAVALLAQHIPFVTDGGNGGLDLWDQAGSGAVPVILVDPTAESWQRLGDARAPVMVVTTRPMGRGETLDALGRGAVAIVAAERIGEALVPALTLAAAGHLTIDPAAANWLIAAAGTHAGEADTGLPELTIREGDILRSIAAGHSVRQTARSLGIAEKTVENTQARLFRKLGARNRAGALATAHALGLLELLDP
ncbi:LuxR C-terminal-related transcriptional regulator [Phytohabitans sp. ZYX-F-186]|uniref:LuxR C-terminal-related transcriptional regulator n=1 Tax=Phytohabitans maris TaxID=3071409 RepID=A0ABU0ZS73_9ACTN|nr:LuxR C-terminal-related transcriptional regulator [Phytohabitans sp. ZYX-F-186]MDQ7908797.1 LuxR C-terminal-related transcriptional regulator [Phytohabitans sp. ZYX-F-186]